MPMLLIAGNYKIIHAAPDGDSIRFYPNKPDLWKKLTSRVHTNHAGGAQLRLDGIDALETHYQARVGLGMQHQPLQLAHAASDELLKFFGFSQVKRGANEIVTAATPEEIPGFILTRFADTYGRCVAFAFKGNPPATDGHEVRLNKTLLHQSANYHLLTEGLAYPTFYSKLYVDLRKEMSKTASSARSDKKGIWKLDKTTDGFELENLKTLTDDVVILPKLFRRLISYLAINDGSISLAGFLDYLEAQNDRVLILPDGHFTGFDYAVEVKGQHIQLTTAPENLVFEEK
jgi:endonuclease YncB( thermonuclease family)